MNAYDRRRPARVGQKQTTEEQADCCTIAHKIMKQDKKGVMVAGIVLLFVFLQGLLIGKLTSK